MDVVLFQLDVPVLAQGPVELWLGELQMQQQTSLHSVIKAADLQINDPGFELLTFLNTFQAQVGMCALKNIISIKYKIRNPII